MSDNSTYCPHCWAEVRKDDTTCGTCGELIEHASGDEKYYYPTSSRYIWSLIFFIVGIIVTGLVSL